MRRMLAGLMLALPLWCVAAALELPISDDSMAGQPRTGTLSGGHTSLAGIRLNRTSLKQVQSLLGAAEVFRVSDSDGANKALCYISSKAQDSTAIILESGAMGAWEIVTSNQ